LKKKVVDKKPEKAAKKKPSDKKLPKKKASKSSDWEDDKVPKKKAKKLAEVQDEPSAPAKPQQPACKGKSHDNIPKEGHKVFRWFPSWSKKQLTALQQEEEEE
jgi:hypothetical protein